MKILDEYRQHRKKIREDRAKDLHIVCRHCGRDISRFCSTASPPIGMQGTPQLIAPLLCPYCGRSRVQTSPLVKP